MNINIRLRKDSGKNEPEYTEKEIMSKLINKTAEFQTNETGTIFIVDKEKTNKIMGVAKLLL
jgi:hypothetical protein